MAEAEVGLRASLKDRAQTARGLRDIEQGVDRVGRSADTAGRRAKLGARGFDAMRSSGRLAANAIKVGFGVALAAGYGVVRLMRSSFEEAREAQKVGAITRATVKSMGAAAAVSARHVDRLSGRLSMMAGIDDEIIQGGANVVLRFAQIRNEMGKGNKVYDRAVTAATDMAAALAGGSGGEINVAAASKTVGKALADPEKGISALRKAQIVLTESQQDSIKTMVDQGNTLGAQKVILGALEDRYKGTAKAQATWGDKADVLVKNIEERLGTALLPLLDDLERWFVKKGGPALDHYVDIFEDKGVPAIGHFVDEARPLVRRVLPSLATGLGDVRDILSAAAPYAVDLVGAFKGMPGWARKAIVGGALAGFVGSKTGVTSAVKGLLSGRGSSGLLGAVSKAKPLPVFVVNEGLGGGIGGAGRGSAAGAAAGGGARSATARAAATLIPQVLAAAGITLGIREFNNRVTPDATLGATGASSSGTGSVPGGLDQAFPDDNPVNDALEQIKGTFSTLFGRGGTVQTDADASTRALTNLMVKPLGANELYATSLEQLLTGPLTDLKNPVVTPIQADTSSAMASVASLAAYTASTLNNALSGFWGSGSTTSTTPTTPPSPKHPKHPKVVAPLTPRVSGVGVLDRQPVPRLGGDIVIHNVTQLDGKTVAENTTKHHRRALDDQ